METKKEFKTDEIKTGNDGHQFGLFDVAFENHYDEIEVGEEFITEPGLNEQSSDHCARMLPADFKRKHLPWEPNLNKSSRCVGSYSSQSSFLNHIEVFGRRKNIFQRFSCEHCQYKSKIKSHLSRHIQEKHLPRNITLNKCSKCEKSFLWRSNLTGHSKICGQTEDSKRSSVLLPCKHCQYETKYIWDLASHIQAKHSPRDPDLNKSRKRGECYSWKSNLSEHLKICGPTEDFKRSLMRLCCYHCQYKTNVKSNLVSHIQRKHLPRNPNLNKCNSCQTIYSSRSYLLKHNKICGKSNEFERSLMRFCCDHCQYETKNKRDLVNHVQAKHLPRDPNLNKCSKCKKSFLQKGYLKRHLKICQLTDEFKRSSRRFSCDHCQYKTNYKQLIVGHIQVEHLPRDSNLNKCNKCGKSFLWKSSLLRHSKICGQTKDFKRSLMRFCCDHCQYKSNEKSNLASHIQAKHLPRDPNLSKCSKCGKSFLWKSSLLKHSKICGLTEDFKRSLMRFCCDHCQYKTNRKPNLAEHVQAKHLPRDPNLNKCCKCGRSFSWKSDLRRHSKICGKTDEVKRSLMRFCCDHCQYKTNRKPNLAEHVQAKHLPRDPNLSKCSKCGKSFLQQRYLKRHLKICG